MQRIQLVNIPLQGLSDVTAGIRAMTTVLEVSPVPGIEGRAQGEGWVAQIESWSKQNGGRAV